MTNLRPALSQDAPALATLGREAFCSAFGHIYHPSDLSRFLEEAYSPGTIAQEISDPALLYRVIEQDDALIGFCKIRIKSPYSDYSNAARPIALGQLYTDPAMTGRGLGAQLMDWVIDYARQTGADAVQLSVYSENFGAQRFYARYGFSKIADIDFWVGNHRDDEFLYELRL
ncbi:GNAT family N-acetyltransferase [Altericroceibacterium endophyticum]|uniref:GNAT family N-acetyltransferase n=1 Tax=Altericroceibacterium endophyticum TaxID=1808508 RepID=A0A6I4T5N0_9SPHN|nr:GNAT family N-acetyltransferase [Altericroceibacterium endophyticum]MXO65065.1 GNAT family N-acetyltransferase [Altericroceibacterium endophyticum]